MLFIIHTSFPDNRFVPLGEETPGGTPSISSPGIMLIEETLFFSLIDNAFQVESHFLRTDAFHVKLPIDRMLSKYIQFVIHGIYITFTSTLDTLISDPASKILGPI